MNDTHLHRTARTYRNTSLLTLLLLILLFILLAWVSTRYPFMVDWTRNSRHTASDTSVAVLGNIDGPVSIVSYAREQADLRLAIERFITRFRRIKPDINLQFRNPDTVPDEVRALGVTINGEMVINYRDRTAHIREADESAFINALIRVTRSQEKWIAFIEGHGERNPLGSANHDLGDWGSHLINRGYRIRPLNLASIGAIPDNTSVVVLAGPTVALLPGENALVLQYLQRGGNLLWLLDPGKGALTDEIADYLGVTVADGTVIDAGGQLIGIDDPSITMLTGSLYVSHPVLDGFKLTTLFPGAAALTVSEDSNWEVTPLLTTATHTWLETGPADATSRFDAGTDRQGPLVIGIELGRTRRDSESRQKVIIIGDGDFLSNRFLQNAGNLDLGVRLVTWLGDDEDLIAIPARAATDTQLTVSPITIGIIGLFFLLVMPVMLALAGLTIWWRRKRS